MIKLIQCLGVILLLAPVTALAQMEPEGRPSVEVNVIGALPVGDFEDNLDEVGLGVNAFLGGQIPGVPLVLGSEFGYLGYGTDNLLEVSGTDVPISVLNVEISNAIFMTHFVGRITPSGGAVRPFIDGLLGLRYFTSRAVVESDVVPGDDDVIVIGDDVIVDDAAFTIARLDDFGVSAGFGGGINIRAHTAGTGWGDRMATVSLTIGARYLFGTEVEYLGAEPISQANGQISVDRVESRTDMIVPQFGLRVDLR